MFAFDFALSPGLLLQRKPNKSNPEIKQKSKHQHKFKIESNRVCAEHCFGTGNIDKELTCSSARLDFGPVDSKRSDCHSLL